MRISVLALGNWGTALANYLCNKGHDVLGWSNQINIVESVNSKKINPEAFSAIKLHENFRATADLDEAIERDLLVLSFPSAALGEMGPQLEKTKAGLIISAIKGLEQKSLKTPLQFMKCHIPADANLVVLSGPSFAVDLINLRPIGIVAGSENEAAAWQTAEIFSGPTLKVYISTDPLGVELGGILKNTIALAVGVCDGLGYGDSARASLITRGLAEMKRLATAMGADHQTLSGLSGLGDLVMTSTCDTSRNRTVGLRLAKGESLKDITRTLGSVAEGVVSSPFVKQLADKYKVEMPITNQVCRFLKGEVSIPDAASELLSRPSKREF